MTDCPEMKIVLKCSARAEKMHNAAIRMIQDNIDSPSMGCEVGILRGELSLKLLQKLNNLTLYMVDCYLADRYRNTSAMKIMMQLAFVNTLKYEDRRIFLVGKSLQVSCLVEDESLDFVYIDAAHDEKSVTTDIDAWYPKVRKGGLVSGHDYANYHTTGVRRAINKFARNNDYKVQVIKSNWWFVKR